MKLVKCIKERNTRDCELGKEFWMDETTIYKDSDGDTYVESKRQIIRRYL